MDDFYAARDRMRRQGKTIRLMAFVWMIFVLCLVFGGVGLTIYALTSPEIIGEFAGRIVAGFESANP